MLVHDLSPKFAVLSNVGPGLRRGREVSPEGPDSTELVREVVPVVVGDVGVGDVVVVVVVEVGVGVAVGVVGVTIADLLGAKFESLVERMSEGLLWPAVWPRVFDPPC